MDFLEVFAKLQSIWLNKYGGTIVTNCPSCVKPGIYPVMYDSIFHKYRKTDYTARGASNCLWKPAARPQSKCIDDFLSHMCCCCECNHLSNFSNFVNFNAGELTTIAQFFQEKIRNWWDVWEELVNTTEITKEWDCGLCFKCGKVNCLSVLDGDYKGFSKGSGGKHVQSLNDFLTQNAQCLFCKHKTIVGNLIPVTSASMRILKDFFNEGKTTNLIEKKEEVPDWAAVEANVKRRTHDNLSGVFS